jgi:hypothetical protein
VALRAGRPEDARRPLAEMAEIVTGAANLGCTAHCLESVAAYAADCGFFERAAVLVAAAESLRTLTGHAHRVWESAGHRRVLAALGPPVRPIDGAVSNRPPTMAAAVALALSTLSEPPP